MNRPKVLQILPMYHEEGEKILRQGAEVIQTNEYGIPHICDRVKDVEGIVLRAPAKITREVIDANPNIKVISGAGVGLDNIDVSYATEKGIPVLHAPSVNKISTAEHAIMMILSLAKQTIPLHDEMKKGNFSIRDTLIPTELKGKKVGLIGFGNIAQEVAKRLSLGFEMDVTAWVREYKPEKHGIAEKLGVDILTNMEDVFSQSDFISLHIPLNNDTRHSINRRYFSLMKPSAYLINTARGAVINQDDLLAALQENRIAGAGLDVFEPEPPEEDFPLLTAPNVILTPHVGGTTLECNRITSTTVAKNVVKVLNGEFPQFIANPEVLYREVRHK